MFLRLTYTSVIVNCLYSVWTEQGISVHHHGLLSINLEIYLEILSKVFLTNMRVNSRIFAAPCWPHHITENFCAVPASKVLFNIIFIIFTLLFIYIAFHFISLKSLALHVTAFVGMQNPIAYRFVHSLLLSITNVNDTCNMTREKCYTL